MQVQAAPGRARARRQRGRGAAARAAPEANAGAFQCPTNMNTVPHPRETRRFFYEDVSRSVLAAVAAHEAAAPSGGAGLRAKAKVEIPELNTSGDTYRVSSLWGRGRVRRGSPLRRWWPTSVRCRVAARGGGLT